MNGCLAGTGTLAGGTVVYTLVASLLPPAGNNDGPAEMRIAAEEIPRPNSAKPFFFGNVPALLIMSEQEELIALKAVCTHFECSIHYDPALRQIVCPCHRGFFDVYGNNLKGPPPRPLTRYQVRREADEWLISRKDNP